MLKIIFISRLYLNYILLLPSVQTTCHAAEMIRIHLNDLLEILGNENSFRNNKVSSIVHHYDCNITVNIVAVLFLVALADFLLVLLVRKRRIISIQRNFFSSL